MTTDKRQRILEKLDDFEADVNALEREPSANDDAAAKLNLWVARQRRVHRMGLALAKKQSLSGTAAHFLEMMIVLAQGLNEVCAELTAQDSKLKTKE
jgi:hypothetical protein